MSKRLKPREIEEEEDIEWPDIEEEEPGPAKALLDVLEDGRSNI